MSEFLLVGVFFSSSLLLSLSLLSSHQPVFSPPFPVSRRYELRVIIWNIEEVPPAEEASLTGEAMSDIYLKG